MVRNAPILDEVRVYPLEQVAEMTGLSHRALLTDCRAGRLEHVAYGRARGMTLAQIRKLVDAYTRGAVRAAEMTELDWAVELSRRSGGARAARR